MTSLNLDLKKKDETRNYLLDDLKHNDYFNEWKAYKDM